MPIEYLRMPNRRPCYSVLPRSTNSVTCDSDSASPTISMSGCSAITACTSSLIRRGRFAIKTLIFRTRPSLPRVTNIYVSSVLEKVQLRATLAVQRVLAFAQRSTITIAAWKRREARRPRQIFHCFLAGRPLAIGSNGPLSSPPIARQRTG